MTGNKKPALVERLGGPEQRCVAPSYAKAEENQSRKAIISQGDQQITQNNRERDEHLAQLKEWGLST